MSSPRTTLPTIARSRHLLLGGLPTCSIAEAIDALWRPPQSAPRRNVPSYAVRMLKGAVCYCSKDRLEDAEFNYPFRNDGAPYRDCWTGSISGSLGTISKND
jgi:hypothetical protein